MASGVVSRRTALVGVDQDSGKPVPTLGKGERKGRERKWSGLRRTSRCWS